jgi:hypothetical protein
MEPGQVVGFESTMSGGLLATGGESGPAVVMLWAWVFREVGQPAKEKSAGDLAQRSMRVSVSEP